MGAAGGARRIREVDMKGALLMLMSLSAFIPVLFVAMTPGAASAFDRPTGRSFGSRSETIARNGMVCAAQPLAVEIGLDVLKAGGNAIDAAIAVNAALGLMEPVSCGVGGDLFAIVWDAKTQKLYGLNASGRSPYLLTIDEVKKRGAASMPYTGVLPQTVPGCVDGWFELHKRFGKLPMKDLLARHRGYRALLGDRRPEAQGRAEFRGDLPARRTGAP